MPEPPDPTRRVLTFLRRNPGAHLRKLHRGLDIPLTSLARLMWHLEAKRRVHAERDGFFTRYWPTHKPRGREREVIALLHNRRTRAIAEALRKRPNASHGEIAASLALPPSTLTYYLKKFQGAGLLAVKKEGVVRRYRLRDRALVSRALRRLAASKRGTG